MKSTKRSKGRVCLCAISFALLSFGLFNPLKGAFEALHRYDYFKAKALFEKALNRHLVPASYGLSVIYGRHDNPFYDLDKSYQLIQAAQRAYPLLSDRKKEAIAGYGISLVTLENQRNHLYKAFYEIAKKKGQLHAIADYLARYPQSYLIPDAEHLRDSLAFAKAEKANTYQAYKAFYKRYPRAAQVKMAEKRYENLVFQAETGAGSLQAYLDFVKRFPHNPHAKQAWDQIYARTVTTGSERENRNFVARYADSPVASRAWTAILYMNLPAKDYAAFIARYPNAPKAIRDRYQRLIGDSIYQIAVDKKFGFVKSDGQVLVSPRYEFVNDFSEGLALVADPNYIGYIDRDGKTVIPFSYDEGSDFHGGLATVQKDGRYGVVDFRGKLVVPVDYDHIQPGGEDIILAEKAGVFTYFNRRGKPAFRKNFTSAKAFSKGRAIVGMGGRQGVIDTSGRWVIKPEFQDLSRLSNGNYVAEIRDRYAVLGAAGSERGTQRYDFIGGEGDGLLIVGVQGKFGYADLMGKTVIKPRFPLYPHYGETAVFDHGYARVKLHNKVGLIDKSGKRVFNYLYDSIGDLKRFPVACKRGGKWGYVREDFTRAVPYIYDVARAFQAQTAVVAKGGRFGLIDTAGTLVIPLQYRCLKRIPHNAFIACRGPHYGVVDAKGQTLVPFVFDDIEQVDDDLLRLIAAGRYNYYDTRLRKSRYGAMPVAHRG